MGSTNDHALPFPAQTDPPNGAAQIQSLAVAVDKALTDVAKLSSDHDAIVDAQITDLYGKVPTAQARWGRSTLATNASGEATLTHDAKFVPQVVILTPESSRALALTTVAGSATSTTVKVRVWNVDTGSPLANATCGCAWIVRD